MSLNKKGFTLIELLVVITIIGILAVGGIQVYTSQIQKARDSTRVSNIMTLGSGFQQFLMDKGSFPTGTATFAGTPAVPGGALGTINVDGYLNTYIPTITNITESRIGSACAASGATTSVCGYVFTIGVDSSSVSNAGYEVSAAFENSGNVGPGSRAAEGGNDPVRFENGNNINVLNSNPTAIATASPHAITGNGTGVIN